MSLSVPSPVRLHGQPAASGSGSLLDGALAQAVLAAMREGWVVTAQGVVLDVSAELCRMTGFEPGELVGCKAPFPFWCVDDVEQTEALRCRVLCAQGGDFDVLLQRKNGERFIALCSSRAVRDPGGSVIAFVSSIRDVHAERVREEHLRRLAETDALTGVMNRRAFDAAIADALEAASAMLAPPTVLLIDLNQFKPVNDALGHATGDIRLQACAASWRTVLDPDDLLARLGGDEFAVLLGPGCCIDPARVAERLRAAAPHAARCAVGLATWDGQEDAAELLRRADTAMYADKPGQGPGSVPAPITPTPVWVHRGKRIRLKWPVETFSRAERGGRAPGSAAPARPGPGSRSIRDRSAAQGAAGAYVGAGFSPCSPLAPRRLWLGPASLLRWSVA